MGRDDESSTVMLTADTGTGQVWDNGDKPSHSYK